MLKRHAIQVLRQAGHAQAEVARLVGVGLRSVRRVDGEPAVTHIDEAAGRARRARLGDPRRRNHFARWWPRCLAGDPDLLSVEILRRAKLKGYAGGEDRALRSDQRRAAEDGAARSCDSRVWLENSRNTISATWTSASSMARGSACISSPRG